MNKAGISQVISQIDFNYIQEAMEADKVLLNGKGKENRYGDSIKHIDLQRVFVWRY